MSHPAATGPIAVEDLRAEIEGSVIGPADAGYEDASTVMYGGPVRPAVIVQAASSADVIRTIALARETGLELAVRSGGHSGAGHGTCDRGIVLDVSPMKRIAIDLAARTVWADAGLTAAELSTAVAEHGLAIGFGDTGSVGIGGITTGGGVGYLVRKFGLTIDNLLAADVVTADGTLVRTDAEHEPDLFWAIRGGGGNFGVVTRFQFGLHEVPSIVGGMIVLPATEETITGFIAAADAAPDEISTIANVMPCPPMPFVPEEHHGKLVILGLMAYAGDPATGEQALAPFRALATPIADLLKPMTYPELFPPDDPDYHPIAVSRTLFVEHVDQDVARLILDKLDEHLRTTNAEMVVTQLRVLGGASARIPVDATAYAHRQSPIMVNVAALVPTQEDIAAHLSWIDEVTSALDQGVAGAYVNFVSDEGPERVRDAYPGATWDRLVAIKDRYDPTNLFHLNQNVVPSGGSETPRLTQEDGGDGFIAAVDRRP